MDPFATATALTVAGEDHFEWDVPDGWQQGRGAWGGLVVGALVRAITASEPDPLRSVRSVSAQLLAPARVGRLSVQVSRLRKGAAMSTWSATAMDDAGLLVAQLVAVLGATRVPDSGLDFAQWGTLVRPAIPPAEKVPRLPMDPPFGPVFAQHINARPVSGAPTSGGPAETIGWIGYDQPTIYTAESIIGLVDAWWPACLATLTSMRPVATVSFAANLLVDPASLTPDEPLLHHAFVSAAAEGFTSEQRRLWSADGRLVVDNLQSIVLLA